MNLSAGETWKNSPVVAYGRAQRRTTRLEPSRARRLHPHLRLSQERQSGRNEPSSSLLYACRTARRAVYFYRGDQWDNYEAVGYIEEEHTINFVVFTARGKEQFERYLPDFHALLSSHDMFRMICSTELRNQAQKATRKSPTRDSTSATRPSGWRTIWP